MTTALGYHATVAIHEVIEGRVRFPAGGRHTDDVQIVLRAPMLRFRPCVEEVVHHRCV